MEKITQQERPDGLHHWTASYRDQGNSFLPWGEEDEFVQDTLASFAALVIFKYFCQLYKCYNSFEFFFHDGQGSYDMNS